MFLYTIAPCDMVFPPKYKDVKYYKLKNGYAEYTNLDGKNIITSINSTDLRDYLNKNLQPGSQIE